MRILANWINNGNTQTTVIINGSCNSEKKGIFNFSTAPYPARQWVLGPKSAIAYFNCQVSVVNFNALRDKRSPVYIFGQAKYQDGITEEPRVTQFCMEVTPIAGGPTANSLSASVIACETHNCADKECDIYKPFQ